MDGTGELFADIGANALVCPLKHQPCSFVEIVNDRRLLAYPNIDTIMV